MTGLDHRHSDRTIITDYNYRNGLLLSLTHIIYTVCPRVHTWNMYSWICMLSQYKTHVGLELIAHGVGALRALLVNDRIEIITEN